MRRYALLLLFVSLPSFGQSRSLLEDAASYAAIIARFTDRDADGVSFDASA